MTFQGLFDSVQPAFEIPDDDLVGQILVPAMRGADEVRLSAGFFTSRCLAQIAPGLATLVNDSEASLYLLMSPEIADEDREAIERGVREPNAVLEDAAQLLFERARLSESAVARHTVQALAYLLASGRLKMRIVLMQRGMYHKKIWLFRSGDDWLAVHGSGNATERGLLVNGEQMSIDRAWADGQQAQARVQMFLDRWERRWSNEHPSSLTIEPTQLLSLLRGYSSDLPPTAADFWEAWQLDHEAGLEPELPPGVHVPQVHHRLRIPDGIEWRQGRFAHQGRAVDALLEHRGGIISIATGGGKTLTALIATTKMQDAEPRHLCGVVVVPTRPLVRQWTKEVKAFGVDPIVLTGRNARDRQIELERLAVAFRTERPRTEVLLMSNALFTSSSSVERRAIEGLARSVECVLIADEVHNLGTPAFLSDPPEFYERRIGLSATPIRQYDPDGTDQLFEFFGGPPVFEFSLADAIESGCLVPYSYHIHVVELDSLEMDHYEYLTRQLAQAGFRVDDDGRTVALSPRIERLLRERRALIEQADAKLPALERELLETGSESVTRTLIYTSAKPQVLDKPKQITAVNAMLERLHIISHQYTSRETGTARGNRILERFDSGDYQVLTAMKVLDEGVDIPQTDTAFLLASSTVQREWVQRRGRILRHAPGKKEARLHDFVVLPPDADTVAGQSLLRSELRRAAEFARLAENEFDPEGPNEVIRELEAMIWRDERG